MKLGLVKIPCAEEGNDRLEIGPMVLFKEACPVEIVGRSGLVTLDERGLTRAIKALKKARRIVRKAGRA